MTTAAATQFLPVIASAGAETDSMVVSVHDIAPCNRHIVEPMLERLARMGVRVCSLLVVPHYHHEKLIADDAPFISWLRGLEADGHEIVIHGYFHERPRRAAESIKDQIVTRFYTRGEGEFFDLGYDEAYRRITKAQEVFREHGLKPTGFIAPAWLLSAEGEQAARDAGMEYTTRLHTVRDLRSGQIFGARSLVYSVHNNWRRVASLAWNRLMLQAARDTTLLRLSVHPPDFQHPAIWSQIERFTKEAMETRAPTTYRDWLSEQRQRAALN
jgi:predicted deacetylase